MVAENIIKIKIQKIARIYGLLPAHPKAGLTGLPQADRTAAETALTGFHSTIGCSHCGKAVGIKIALEKKVRIINNREVIASTVSGLDTVNPTATPNQTVAYAKNIIINKPIKNPSIPDSVRQPIAYEITNIAKTASKDIRRSAIE